MLPLMILSFLSSSSSFPALRPVSFEEVMGPAALIATDNKFINSKSSARAEWSWPRPLNASRLLTLSWLQVGFGKAPCQAQEWASIELHSPAPDTEHAFMACCFIIRGSPSNSPPHPPWQPTPGLSALYSFFCVKKRLSPTLIYTAERIRENEKGCWRGARASFRNPSEPTSQGFPLLSSSSLAKCQQAVVEDLHPKQVTCRSLL